MDYNVYGGLKLILSTKAIKMKEDKVYLRTKIPKSLHIKLKKICLEEGRTIEHVAANLISDWVNSHENDTKTDNQDDKEDLVRFIRGIAQGNRPTDQDCIFAAHEAGFDAELAIKLRDRLFDGAKNGNGINFG